MTNYKTYLMLFIFFTLGIATTLFFGDRLEDDHRYTHAASSNNDIEQVESRSASNLARLDERIDKLEIQSGALSYSLQDINNKIDSLLNKLDTTDTERTDRASRNPLPTPDRLTGNQIISAKSRILADLSNDALALPDILDSGDMKSLPADDREEILAEIARRLDAGEIDKSQFLPGYQAR